MVLILPFKSTKNPLTFEAILSAVAPPFVPFVSPIPPWPNAWLHIVQKPTNQIRSVGFQSLIHSFVIRPCSFIIPPPRSQPLSPPLQTSPQTTAPVLPATSPRPPPYSRSKSYSALARKLLLLPQNALAKALPLVRCKWTSFVSDRCIYSVGRWRDLSIRLTCFYDSFPQAKISSPVI